MLERGVSKNLRICKQSIDRLTARHIDIYAKDPCASIFLPNNVNMFLCMPWGMGPKVHSGLKCYFNTICCC